MRAGIPATCPGPQSTPVVSRRCDQCDRRSDSMTGMRTPPPPGDPERGGTGAVACPSGGIAAAGHHTREGAADWSHAVRGTAAMEIAGAPQPHLGAAAATVSTSANHHTRTHTQRIQQASLWACLQVRARPWQERPRLQPSTPRTLRRGASGRPRPRGSLAWAGGAGPINPIRCAGLAGSRRLDVVDGHLHLNSGLDADGGDLLHHVGGGDEVDQALVDPAGARRGAAGRQR